VEKEEDDEEEEKGLNFWAMMPIIMNVYPQYEKKKKKSRLQGLAEVSCQAVYKKELQKLWMQNSILSIEIMKSCPEYIMCNFHWNKGPHEAEPWERN
jgi:hypothetical protein